MPAQSAADAGFYSLVHDVLETNKLHSGENRRDNDRVPFHCVQLVAPYPNGQFSAASKFRHVRCQDLSPTGMSYYDTELPECPQLLVLLGSSPVVILTAEVVHQKPVDEEGRNEFLIGCRFTGRLHQKEEAAGH
ncbi:MAG TPA: hypothetical protein VGJ15_05560 [Pirellulales bacterium]|jgi:hypothetical protein